MAQHDVWFTVPARSLGTADAEFQVWADGKKLGKLAISKGSVVWWPNGTTYGHKMKWAKFDEVMRSNASKYETR